MVKKKPIFRYVLKKGPLHKIPALIKLVSLFILSVSCVYIPPFYLVPGIIAVIILALLCGINLYNQLTDFKPVFLYTVILYLFSVLSNLTGLLPFDSPPHSIFLPNSVFIRTALRLVIIVQLSALLFRTTSSLEIREAVKSDTFSLFLGFIPDIFNSWANIDLAWKARGGKPGIKKIKTLVFVLISVSFERAAVKAKALEARRHK